LYAELRQKDKALQWLSTAGLKTDVLLDAIRFDPRFAELMRKVGLSQ
jgi:hypothetical protein